MFCKYCGEKIDAGVRVCPHCHNILDDVVGPQMNTYRGVEGASTLRLLAFVFALISLILTAIAIVPLCWTIPMTMHIYRGYKYNMPISLAFKVCTLFFLSFIGGILLLCDQDL